MITVVHIITALGSGGAERVLYLVATGRAERREIRHVVVSLTDEGIYGPKLRAAGVELACLGMQRGRSPLASFLALVRLLRTLRPNVLMTWLYHADLMGTLAGRLAGVRQIIWNVRCSDMDFKRYAPTTRRIVGVLARLSRVPWAVATNSEAGRSAHESLGYHPKRWVYLPNGYDTELWKPDAADRASLRHELGFSETDRVIGMVARVDPQKDHASFLAAAAELQAKRPDVRVLLVGRGTRQLALPEALRSAVVAVGERQDVPRLTRTLDLLVSSSAYGEGFPNVIGEAMASGIACVATDVGDSDLIIGDTGRIVPPRDTAALAAAIAELLDLPPAELHALGLRARRRIETEFSIDGCLERYGALFALASSARTASSRRSRRRIDSAT
jgi:glycosyltransferase involved in cell wall biosynthesis